MKTATTPTVTLNNGVDGKSVAQVVLRWLIQREVSRCNSPMRAAAP
jgi:diketogulonate reductase-like aldo/keto reductase